MCTQELMQQLQTGGLRTDAPMQYGPAQPYGQQSAPSTAPVGAQPYGVPETGAPAQVPAMFDQATMQHLMKAICHV